MFNAVVPLEPPVPATVTAVSPASVVDDAPKSIAVVPTVTLSLASLLLAILPLSMALVTEPVCPVCIISLKLALPVVASDNCHLSSVSFHLSTGFISVLPPRFTSIPALSVGDVPV